MRNEARQTKTLPSSYVYFRLWRVKAFVAVHFDVSLEHWSNLSCI